METTCKKHQGYIIQRPSTPKFSVTSFSEDASRQMSKKCINKIVISHFSRSTSFIHNPDWDFGHCKIKSVSAGSSLSFQLCNSTWKRLANVDQPKLNCSSQRIIASPTKNHLMTCFKHKTVAFKVLKPLLPVFYIRKQGHQYRQKIFISL